MKNMLIAFLVFFVTCPAFAAEVINSGATNPVAPYGDYINFGSKIGSPGYGFRTNNGTIESKNLAGSWTTFGGMSAAIYDPQTIAGDAFNLALHTGNLAGVAAPYIAQNSGTGTTITLAGTSTFPSGVWGSTGYVGIGTTTVSPQNQFYGVSNYLYGRGATFMLDDSQQFLVDARTNPRGVTIGIARINMKAAIAGVRSLMVDVDAAGYGDIKGVAVQYTASNIVAGKTANVFEALVDSANATGGNVYGLALMKTGTGTIEMTAVKAMAGTNLVEQEAGTLINMDTGFNYSGSFTDITTALGTTTTNVQIFTANNAYLYVGHSVPFTSLEVLLATVSSGQGIKPSWEYSQGSSAWTTFTPIDGTNGFRQNGDVFLGTLPAWAVDTVNGVASKYWIRCQRTNSASITIPVENIIQIVPGTTYTWDKNGVVSVNQVSGQNITVTGTSTLSGTITTNTGIWGSNFGVGTTVPSQKIHAVGNIQATGEFIEGVGSTVSTASLIPYIQLSSTANQIPVNTNATLITYTHVDEQQIFNFTPTSGIITIPEDGVYFVIAGGQCAKASGTQVRLLDLWLRKNDVDVPRSSVRNTMNETTDSKVVIQNTGLRLNANDTLKIYIAVDSITGSSGLYATTPSVGPIIPAIIVTVFKISQ